MLITRPPEKLYMMFGNDLCSKFYADSHGDNERASKMSKFSKNLKKYRRGFRPKVRQLVLSGKHGSNMSTPYQATQFAPRSPEQKRKPGQTLYERAWPSATLNNTGGGRFAPAPCIIDSFIQCLTGFSFLFGRTRCELRGLERCAHVGAMFSTSIVRSATASVNFR